MVEAKRCDRCGRFEKRPVTVPDLKLTKSPPDIPQKSHLCRECRDAFYEWWENDSGDPGGGG